MEIRRRLLNNMGLKAVSVLLAFLLWLTVSSEQAVERTVSIPVEFLNIPALLEISNDYTKTLDVNISTRRGMLAGGTAGMYAVVNLQDARLGERIVPITESAIRRPDGVTILNITPSRVTLVLERTWSKMVPVEPQVIGSPGAGYQITWAKAVPADIMIAGPESRVRRALRAITEPIQVAGGTIPMHRDVNVDVGDPRLRIDRATPVRVEVLIEEERTSQRVTVPVTADAGVRPSVQTLQVQVSYPKSHRIPVNASMFSARLEKPSDAVAGEERDVVPRVTPSRQVEKLVRIDGVFPEKIRIRIL